MKFIPNSEIKKSMLSEIGLKNIDDLFSDIPKKIKAKELDLTEGLTQIEVERKLRTIALKNKSCCDLLSFIGGGIKPHYVPSVVRSICSRGEFYTAYTPYQSEASQGFLQAMFEYQSMITEITGMNIANCSLYDGVTALGEAALMCSRIGRKKNSFLIPNNISWEKKSVLHNYTKGAGLKIKEIQYNKKTGKLDIDNLKKIIDENTAGVYIENPNFFGIFEDEIENISKIVHDSGSLLVVGVDPISLGLIRNPGSYNADIVIGEGRALGNAMDFGGSSLGLFACKKEFLRQMPGRIIGMTKDKAGKRAFCMALQTREQHIRRGKATSNICTNEGLCSLAAGVYMSWLGEDGFEKLSKQNFENGQKLAKKINSIDGFKLMFPSIHFNEFVIKCPNDPKEINKNLLLKNIHGGLVLEEWFRELKNCMLVGITEMYTDDDINIFTSLLKEASNV